MCIYTIKNAKQIPHRCNCEGFVFTKKLLKKAKKEMAVLFVITGLLTQFMSNTAAAALLCPIGLSIAESLGASPTAVVLAIGFSASAAYITPVATPPNTMVYGPGGLQFMDYVKVGTPLFVIVMIMALILMPIIWPFFPNA